MVLVTAFFYSSRVENRAIPSTAVRGERYRIPKEQHDRKSNNKTHQKIRDD